MKSILPIVVLTFGLLGHTAQGSLLHAYNFLPDAPLADAVGGVELAMEGTVAFAPEGYATFDGKGGYLQAEDLHLVGGTYTVSFWFRSDYIEPDAQDKSPGILSASDTNRFVAGTWSFGLRRGVARFGGKVLAGGAVNQALEEKPEPGIWQLITLQFTEDEGGGVWVNDGPFIPFELFRPEGHEPPPAFKAIARLVVGSNLVQGESFTGDIADIRIYDGADWDDSKQSVAFQAGPSLGASVTPGTPR